MQIRVTLALCVAIGLASASTAQVAPPKGVPGLGSLPGLGSVPGLGLPAGAPKGAPAGAPKGPPGAAADGGPPGKGRAFATEGCIEKIPGPPINLKGRAVNESAIVVTWDAPLGNTCVDSFDYYVVKKGDPAPRTIRPDNKDGYSITIGDLKRDTEYTFYVASVNDAKGKSRFAAVDVRTKKERCSLFSVRKPGKVTDVKFFRNSRYTANINWLPPADGGCAWWYRVESFDASSGKRLSQSVSIDADTVVRVKDNMVYDYRITPVSLLAGNGPSTRATLSTMKGPVASGSIPAGRRLKA